MTSFEAYASIKRRKLLQDPDNAVGYYRYSEKIWLVVFKKGLGEPLCPQCKEPFAHLSSAFSHQYVACTYCGFYAIVSRAS